MSTLRLRFVFELAAVLAGCVGLALTVLVRDWIELVFRVDPDHRSGSAEWLIIGVALAVTLVGLVLAHAELRRARIAAAPVS